MLHYANERFTHSCSLILLGADLFFNKFNLVGGHGGIEMTKMIISILSWIRWCIPTFLILGLLLQRPVFQLNIFIFVIMTFADILFKSIHFTAYLSWISRSLQPILIPFYLISLYLPRSAWAFGWLNCKLKSRKHHTPFLWKSSLCRSSNYPHGVSSISIPQ